jgi:hypothetical protein
MEGLLKRVTYLRKERIATKTQIRLSVTVGLIGLTLASVVGMVGCAGSVAQPPATQAPATQPPPTQPPVPPTPTPLSNSDIVLSMVERLNAGDVEGSLAYFAVDAVVYLMGFPPTGIEVCAGKEQIRALWEDSAANHFHWEIEIRSAHGDQVEVAAKTWHDFTLEVGVAPLDYNDVYEVKFGKIRTYASRITEDSLARFRPVLAEMMPAETLPASPDTAVSEMTVTIEGGTCHTDSPLSLQAGEVKVIMEVKDRDRETYAVSLWNLDEPKDWLDLMAATDEPQPGWAHELLWKDASQNSVSAYTVTVEQGPVYLVCWATPPDLSIGNAGPFTVVPAMPEPTPTPELVKSAVTDLQYLVGTWVRSEEGAIQFNADGTYLVSETVAGIASGQASHGECRFDESLLIFADQDGSGDGSYTVELRTTVDGDPVSLKMRAVDDPFVDRRETLNSVWAWVAP